MIGIFDSGIGGLTVFREVEQLLPEENLIYFADAARLPYGNKSPETVVHYTLKSAQFLLNQGIKLLIIACHTASSQALKTLQETLPIPVLGMVKPSIDLLLSATKTKRVAVLGTKSTIHSGIYQNLIPSSITLFMIACPLFVPLVEEQFFDHKATLLIANHYLRPLHDIDTALLACTHYPLIQKTIQQVLGPSVTIINPAVACAQLAKELLENHSLLNTKRTHNPQFYTTDRILINKEFQFVDID